MSQTKMLTVFCYDVSGNRNRNRLAKILESYAIRVQKSVFEARLTAKEAERISKLCATELDQGDSLRVYSIDMAGYRRTKTYGSAVILQEQEFLLV